jgi:hypothetical protein
VLALPLTSAATLDCMGLNSNVLCCIVETVQGQHVSIISDTAHAVHFQARGLICAYIVRGCWQQAANQAWCANAQPVTTCAYLSREQACAITCSSPKGARAGLDMDTGAFCVSPLLLKLRLDPSLMVVFTPRKTGGDISKSGSFSPVCMMNSTSR